MPEAVSRPKIGDLVARKLTASIASQGLKPEDRPTSENELAASLGVSRLSLREATKALKFLVDRASRVFQPGGLSHGHTAV